MFPSFLTASACADACLTVSLVPPSIRAHVSAKSKTRIVRGKGEVLEFLEYLYFCYTGLMPSFGTKGKLFKIPHFSAQKVHSACRKGVPEIIQTTKTFDSTKMFDLRYNLKTLET